MNRFLWVKGQLPSWSLHGRRWECLWGISAPHYPAGYRVIHLAGLSVFAREGQVPFPPLTYSILYLEYVSHEQERMTCNQVNKGYKTVVILEIKT